MQALLFRNWFSKLNGAVIDAFEYYIKILENNPHFRLIIIDGLDFEPLYEVFENRYFLDDINYRDNIMFVTRNDLIYMNFDKVLVLDYSTIKETRGLLHAKEIIVISDLYTDNPLFMYDKKLNKVTYYGEMPFVYKDVQYRMKCLFCRFKRLHRLKEGYYINSPRNEDFSFVNKLEINHTLPIYYKQDDHVNNFFELFHCYIYYHANTYFDPHPRLFLECMFYKKSILYYNERAIKDGSYYRYRDLYENGLDDRRLNKNDEIVRLFI